MLIEIHLEHLNALDLTEAIQLHTKAINDGEYNDFNQLREAEDSLRNRLISVLNDYPDRASVDLAQQFLTQPRVTPEAKRIIEDKISKIIIAKINETLLPGPTGASTKDQTKTHGDSAEPVRGKAMIPDSYRVSALGDMRTILQQNSRVTADNPRLTTDDLAEVQRLAMTLDRLLVELDPDLTIRGNVATPKQFALCEFGPDRKKLKASLTALFGSLASALIDHNNDLISSANSELRRYTHLEIPEVNGSIGKVHQPQLNVVRSIEANVARLTELTTQAIGRSR